MSKKIAKKKDPAALRGLLKYKHTLINIKTNEQNESEKKR